MKKAPNSNIEVPVKIRTKHQHPSSRETSNFKLQTSEKLQAPILESGVADSCEPKGQSALQNLAGARRTTMPREASWSAAALCRFLFRTASSSPSRLIASLIAGCGLAI